MTNTEKELQYKKSLVILRSHNPKKYMRNWIILNDGLLGISRYFETKEKLREFLVSVGSKRNHAEKWASYIISESSKYNKFITTLSN